MYFRGELRAEQADSCIFHDSASAGHGAAILEGILHSAALRPVSFTSSLVEIDGNGILLGTGNRLDVACLTMLCWLSGCVRPYSHPRCRFDSGRQRFYYALLYATLMASNLIFDAYVRRILHAPTGIRRPDTAHHFPLKTR
jgi:hypothetical protein